MKINIIAFIACTLLVSTSTLSEELDNSALVISGGLSLGVYEAGLNYVLVDSMLADKLPRLKVATGASAGAINAIASAVRSCVHSPAKENIFDNVLRNIWINVDISKLLPPKQEAYSQLDLSKFSNNATPEFIKDSVLNRSIFQNPVKEIHDLFLSDALPNCEVKIGIMVTLAKPSTTEEELADGQKIEVPQQSFAIPILLSSQRQNSGKHKLVFRQVTRELQGKLASNTQGRKYILLRSESNGNIAFTTVIRAALASSAFPGAFGAVSLDYCLLNSKQENECKYSNEQKNTGTFIDGGYFNNIPIGVAVELMSHENENKEKEKEKDTLHLIYIDPDNVKFKPNKEVCQKNADTLTIKNQLNQILPGLSTLRSAVLFDDLIAYFGKNSRTLSKDIHYNPTTRLGSLTGSYLGAFGAFLGKPFRDYDYTVGIYDGIRFVTQNKCSLIGRDLASKTTCEANLFGSMMEKYAGGTTTNSNAKQVSDFRAVIGLLLNQEFLKANKKSNEAWQALTTKYSTQGYESMMTLVHNALLRENCDKFEDFITVFREGFIKFRDGHSIDDVPRLSNHLQYITFYYDFWSKQLIKKILHRLIYIEDKNNGDNKQVLAGAYVLMPALSMNREDFKHTSSTSFERFLFTIMPDEFGIDAVQTGTYFGWSTNKLGGIGQNSLLNLEYGLGIHSQIKDVKEARVHYASLWTGIRKPLSGIFLTSVGFSFNINKNLTNTDRFNDNVLFGTELNAGLLGDKLKISIGTRDALNDYRGEDWSVRLTFTNIEELAWAFK